MGGGGEESCSSGGMVDRDARSIEERLIWLLNIQESQLCHKSSVKFALAVKFYHSDKLIFTREDLSDDC